MVRMSESDFIELVTNLSQSDCCTGDMECSKDTTSYDESLDCAKCWTKRLNKYVEY